MKTILFLLACCLSVLADPPSAGTISFTQATYSTTETSGKFVIPVIRTNGVRTACSVQYETINGSAVAGFDFTTTKGLMSWGPDDNSQRTITVPILNSDTLGPNRAFGIKLVNPTAGAGLGIKQCAVSIEMNALVSVSNVVAVATNIVLKGSISAGGK